MLSMNKKNRYTIKDIAEYAGVGISTVSRVLNKTSNPISITEATKRKIFEAVKKFDYAPNVNAKRLSKDKSFTIALVVPGYSEFGNCHAFSDYTLMETLRGIEDSITGTPYKLLLVFKNQKYIGEKEYLKLFGEKSIDGMLIWGARFSDDYIRELCDYPVVMINSYNEFADGAGYIGHDNVQGSFDVTEHLIAKGYRNFLHFRGIQDNSIAVDRNDGFLKAIRKRNIKIRKSCIVDSPFDWKSAYHAMDELLTGNALVFDAVVSGSDGIAYGVYKAAVKHGKKIPGDFALVGGDGVDRFIESSCPLTTFKVDCFKMGKLAVEKLTALIDGRLKKPFKRLIKTKIVIRDTA